MQVQTSDFKRVIAGRDVLAVLALLLLASGMTTASPFVYVGELLASAGAHLAPVFDGGLVNVLIVVGIYLQAVVLAALYRVVGGVYRALTGGADGAGSA